jgi:hypothetical protein
MKKPASKIRADIARLQEQLRQAETREAERIGRLALKAGLGEIEIDDAKLFRAFEELAKRFAAAPAKPESLRPRKTRLARLLGRIARLERMRQSSQSEARRQDTREKIQLGGLIAKAGLRYEKRALLLGLLIEGARRIRTDETERKRLMAIGERAFADDTE